MNHADFDIEFLTPVAIPAASRTLDDAGSRRFVPGSLLLGCAARVLYPSLGDDDAFRIFQTAAVRFLDGRPIADGVRTVPLPKSFHKTKHGAEADVLNLVDRALRRSLLDDGVQVEGISGRAVTRNLSAVLTLADAGELTLRTSVDDTGRAASGLLYSLDLLPAGLRFRARVLARRDDDLERVAAALGRPGHRIGRARSAELGRVRITRAGTAPDDAETAAAANRVSVLCVSSLALRDAATGMPTFTVRPQDVGLPPSWRFDAGSSFVRTERYSPFHGTRRLPDLERQLIERGSVLTFEGEEPHDADELRAQLAAGVGEHRQTGLGELLVMSGALLEARPRLPKAAVFAPPAVASAPPPGDELFKWALAQATARADARRSFEEALRGARDEARRWRVPPAQWGQLRAMARSARVRGLSAAAFTEKVAAHLSTGVAQLDRLWGRKYRQRPASEHLLEMMKDRAKSNPAAFVEQLAELVVREMRTDHPHRKETP